MVFVSVFSHEICITIQQAYIQQHTTMQKAKQMEVFIAAARFLLLLAIVYRSIAPYIKIVGDVRNMNPIENEYKTTK